MSEQLKSLIKSISILEFISNYPNGVQLHEIVRQTGLNKTTAHRILSTLESMGYVAQYPSTRAYRLTLKMLHVGHGALNSELISVARASLVSLMDDVNETINLLSREGDKIVFRDKLEPQFSSFRTHTYVGMYGEMYCTAAGKVFLAFSTLQDQESYWLRNTCIIRQLTPTTITNKTYFLEEMQRVREQGFAVDNEENERGISCTAVPVFDKSGVPAYVVSISTLTPRLNIIGPENLAAQIKSATEKIELALFNR